MSDEAALTPLTCAPLHATIQAVTDRVRDRSRAHRSAYLERLRAARAATPQRNRLACSNLAHVFAASDAPTKAAFKQGRKANIAIVSAYNDLLSAHQPLEHFPALLKDAIHEAGGLAQLAGGVPAMCDGITQGREGMELSLFSRDVIALSTAIALSHDVFDGMLCLGVCDKIVPGLLIGALSFGHLPALFVPAGPMPSGLPNPEKSRIRKLFAQGKLGREELLEAESASYHSPGTCTFYGTANSNQMLMELMGLHLPGSSFVNPGTELRAALTRFAGQQVLRLSDVGGEGLPLGELYDERTVINGVIGLLATGGSTNHTLHLVAMAAAAGILLTWDEFSDLSQVIPLLARIYPNGGADVNHFHAAGGLGFLMRELLQAGLLHPDARTVMGTTLREHCLEPFLLDGVLTWRPGTPESLDTQVLRPLNNPFSADGGLRILHGNLGRSVIKVSAVRLEHRVVEAPARVFDSQDALLEAFRSGALDRDVVAVVRFQGPKANGMPELHSLTPSLSVLQERGFKVALVTDGRMSGASGQVPAAIHLTPEALDGGPLAYLQDGDLLRVDPESGSLDVLLDPTLLLTRAPAPSPHPFPQLGVGRELFGLFRRAVGGAEQGASAFWQEQRALPDPRSAPPAPSSQVLPAPSSQVQVDSDRSVPQVPCAPPPQQKPLLEV